MRDPALIPTGATRHFLTFRLDDRLYGVAAEDVAEVIRLPSVARIPQSPAGLMGLANLRGSIVPVASGRTLLGQGETILQARAIVLNGAAAVAFAVDAIDAFLEVREGEIQARAQVDPLPGEYLNGSFRSPQNGDTVKLLDIKALVASAIVTQDRTSRRHSAQSADGLMAQRNLEYSNLAKLVSFAVAGQDYALPLDDVQEIVAVPKVIAALPQHEALVLGVATLRDQLLPLFSLRGLLGFPPNPNPGREKVVVIKARGNLLGLVVDEMRAIFPEDPTRMDPVPDILAARMGGEARVAALYRGGDRGLVSILSPDMIFSEDVVSALKQNRQEPISVAPHAVSAPRTFVVFRLGQDECALPVEAVAEVAPVPADVARIPNTPQFLAGVVNLRGEVLPLIDQRQRFGMAAQAYWAACRMIVVRTETFLAGIIVDSVSEVLRTSAAAIEPAPHIKGENIRLVAGAINLEDQNRIVLVLDPSELLSRAERDLLDKIAGQNSALDRSPA